MILVAGYKRPCMHCGNLIDDDARYCLYCSSRSPFGYHCPSCLKPIKMGQSICSACGRPLYIVCPHCGQQTFVDDRCQVCGMSLLVQCPNSRCGEPQFFQNISCTACGQAMQVPKQKKRKGG